MAFRFRLVPLSLVFGVMAAFGLVRVIDSWLESSLGDLSGFFGLLFPADFSNLDILVLSAFETINIAVAGTTIGFLAALVISLLAFESKYGIFQLVSFPAWFSRGVPDVVFAVLFLQIFGPGALTGILALALGTFGVSYKLLIDSLQTRRTQSEQSLVLSGVGSVVRITGVILPQLSREIASQFFVRLEINFRIAVVLGLVGGGGLGLLLSRTLGLMDFQQALAVVLTISLIVLFGEFASGGFRNRLGRYQKSILRSKLLPAILFLLLAWSSLVLLIILSDPIQRFSLDQASRVFYAFITPDFLSQSNALLQGLSESIIMTAAAVAIGVPLSILLALLSSDSIHAGRLWPTVFKSSFALLRSVPIAVLAVLIVIPLGFGSHSAFLAMVIGGGLFLARILGEAFDSKNQALVNHFELSGALFTTRGMVVLANNKPRLARHFFFSLDFLFRYSVILGILGSGGLGVVISNAIRVQDINTVAAASWMIIFIVFVIEQVQRLLLGKTKPVSINPRKAIR